MNYDFIARKEHYGWVVFDTKLHSVEKTNLDFVENLEKQGYVINRIENSLIEGALTAPLKLFINVSNHCNLECIHCFSDSSPHHKESMPFDKMKDLINEAANMGVFLIIIGGGEPFMRTDIWEIISLIREKGMGVSLTTNGTIISPEIITNIQKHNVRMNISFDGCEETHDFIRKKQGAFLKTLSTVKILKEAGIKSTIRFTLMTLNIKDVAYMLHLATSLELQIKIRRAKPSDRAINNMLLIREATPEYYKAIMLMNSDPNCNVEDIMNCSGGLKEPLLLSKSDCGAGTRIMFVEADGTISPCTFLGKNFHSGNFYKNSLSEIWKESPEFQQMRNVPLNEDCKSCHRKLTCHSECPAMRLHIGGSLDAADPSCLKPFFEEYLPLQNL
ncbi:MAG: radical SAM protein [Saprospiraceae bacterium]|nr:radical SAM protein [Candidatus Defluviibacterium haderslevense]